MSDARYWILLISDMLMFSTSFYCFAKQMPIYAFFLFLLYSRELQVSPVME